MMTRYINAKYDGECKHCGKVIKAGQRCRWTRGSGIAHPECWAPETVAARRERGRATRKANAAQRRAEHEAAARLVPAYAGKAQAAVKAQWAHRLGVPTCRVRQVFGKARELGLIRRYSTLGFQGYYVEA